MSLSKLSKRLRRLEEDASVPPATEGEYRDDPLHMARGTNDDCRREGFEPAFKITESGDVFSTIDGRQILTGHQALCERFYRQELEWGGVLIHREDEEAFYTPQGDLALSRTYVHLQHLFYSPEGEGALLE